MDFMVSRWPPQAAFAMQTRYGDQRADSRELAPPW